MNMVSCGENCRYQIDGCCTRSDLIVNGAGKAAVAYGDHSDVSASTNNSKCCYFEQR